MYMVTTNTYSGLTRMYSLNQFYPAGTFDYIIPGRYGESGLYLIG